MADHDRYYQLAAWLRGRPEHNKADDECCPDFSCCAPALLADLETRVTFVEAFLDDPESEKVFHMLGMFLSACMADSNYPSVHVAGDHPTEQ